MITASRIKVMMQNGTMTTQLTTALQASLEFMSESGSYFCSMLSLPLYYLFFVFILVVRIYTFGIVC